jgi:solute carrier family 35 (UDP-galactose transporter), member B1
MQKHSKTVAEDPLPNHPYALLGYGEILLLISLALDGLTGAIQDKMNASYTTHTHTMMYYMNIWSCLWLLLAIVLTGECFEFIVFAQKYNYVLLYLFLLSFLSAIGQVSLYNIIKSLIN